MRGTQELQPPVFQVIRSRRANNDFPLVRVLTRFRTARASWWAVTLGLVFASCTCVAVVVATGCNPADPLAALPASAMPAGSTGAPATATAKSLRPATPPSKGRLAYFFWDWSATAAEIDAFVPLLVGHYKSMCVVFIGNAARVRANVDHVLSIPHPPEFVVGLTTSDLLSSLEDVAGWQELGSLAAWCVERTGVPRIGLDVEWSLHGYLYDGVTLDLAKYEDGLRKFAAYIPGVQVNFYPPNWEGQVTEANMRTVLQRTRVISAAAKCLPDFHAMGASISTYDAYRGHPFGEEYRSLEAFWSATPGPAEQIFLIDDTWWAPDVLRPVLLTIPRECWLYVERPYNTAKADRLIRCLEAPQE